MSQENVEVGSDTRLRTSVPTPELFQNPNFICLASRRGTAPAVTSL
jgi:hypothetical protein